MRKLHQIERVELANQPERQMPRRAGMSGESDAYLSRLQRGWVLAEFLQGLRAAASRRSSSARTRSSVSGGMGSAAVVRGSAQPHLQRAQRPGELRAPVGFLPNP